MLAFEAVEDRRMLSGEPIETSLNRSTWQIVDGGPADLVRIAVSLDEAMNADVRKALENYQKHLAAGRSETPFDITPLKLRLVSFSKFDRLLKQGSFSGIYDNVVIGTSKGESLVGTDNRDLIVGLG
ncbi:MAG TPA: hypothetical protein PLV92_25750, partial [Pirellulaceae bacterium]|nr:hypothetical protein [Pirellulaceae bacterium]